MKKEMIKALSLGLSAVTLAGSMDITAFAAEDEGNEAENQQTTEGQQQVAPSAEQTIVQETQDVSTDINGIEGQPAIDGQPAVEEVPGVIDAVGEIPVTSPNITEGMSGDEIREELQETSARQIATTEILNQQVNIPYTVNEEGQLVPDENGMPLGLYGAATLAGVDAAAAGNAIERTETSVDEETGDTVYEQAGVVADAEAINSAAGAIDTIDREIEGDISSAETAATTASTAAGTAQQAVNLAVDAVNNESVEVAQVVVENAEQTLEDAKAVYEAQKQNVANLRSAYEDALVRRNTALTNYNNAKNNALADNGNLARAEQALLEANLNLEALEKGLEVAQNELKNTAAYSLLQNEANKETDTETYVQTIISISLFEGEEVSVSKVVDEDNNVFFDVKDSDGKLIGKYTYSTDNGVVSINALDLYEFEETDEAGNKTVVVKTKAEMEAMVALKAAVQRVTITDEEGKVTYKLYSALSDEEKAKVADGTYPCDYIVINSANTDDENLNADASTLIQDASIEKVTKQGIAVGSFDKEGNYRLTVTDDTTKKVYTYINGVLQDVKDQKVTTVNGTNAEVEAAAKAKYEELRDAKIAEILNNSNGFTGTDVNGNKVSFTHDEIISVTSNDGLKNPDIYWTLDGYYVPVYVRFGYHETFFDDNIQYERINNLNKKYNYTNQVDLENKIKADIQKANPEVIVGAVSVENYLQVKSNKHGSWIQWNGQADVYYATPIDVNDGSKYTDRASAIEGILSYAIQKQDGASDGWVVCGAYASGDYASRLTTESYYSFTQDAKIKIETHQSGEQLRVYNTLTTAVGKAATAGEVFKSDNTIYNDLLKDTQTKVNALNELINDTKEAEARVQKTQSDVDDIRTQIENLNKADAAKNAVIVAELEARLQLAEQKLADAEQTLSDSSDALDKAKADLDQKIKDIEEAKNSQENGTGSETNEGTTETTTETAGTTTGGGTTRRYYPTTAPVDAVFEPSVVLLDNPQVPLAGDTTTTVTRTVNRTTDVADADTNTDSVTVDEADVPLAVDEDAVEETEEKVDEVSILPEETPLAGGTQENFFQQSWWWLLLLLIAAIGGGTAYAKKKAHDSENTTK